MKKFLKIAAIPILAVAVAYGSLIFFVNLIVYPFPYTASTICEVDFHEKDGAIKAFEKNCSQPSSEEVIEVEFLTRMEPTFHVMSRILRPVVLFGLALIGVVLFILSLVFKKRIKKAQQIQKISSTYNRVLILILGSFSLVYGLWPFIILVFVT